MAAPLLVFDLDGTLVDSAPDLLATLDAILSMHDFLPLADRTLREGIGFGARHLIEFGLHRQRIAVDERQLERMHKDFLAHYESHICVESRLFAGVPELLDRFAAAGWAFAVCTNKLEHLSRQVLSALDVEHRFTAICGGDTFAARKPDPAHLIGTILAASGLRERALMVGDSHIDRDTAHAAAVSFVGVSFGYTPVPMAELSPDLLIDDFNHLTPQAAARLLAQNTSRPRAHAVALS